MSTRRPRWILFVLLILVGGCTSQPAAPERVLPDPTGLSTIDLNSGKMSATLSYTLTRHLTSCYDADITVTEAHASLTRPS